MYSRDPLDTPLDRYLHHGDVRPSIDRLRETAAYMGASSSPTSRLVLADVFIDTAMAADGQAAASAQAMDSARDTLNSVIDDVELMQELEFHQEYVRYAGRAAEAAMRLGELDAWRKAAEGSAVSLNYDKLLSFAWLSAQMSGVDAGSTSRLMEVVPVLLGARAEKLHKAGWLARLSLVREDQRFYQIRDRNANWDVGVASDDSPTAYDHPVTKLQIKSTRKRHQGRYNRAGIKSLSADRLGFRMAHRVIKSCLKESDPSVIVRRHSGKRFLTSDELDEITTKIAEESGLRTVVGEEGIEPSIR
ncbi:MAG TPA: hypothetical protein VHA05_02520 [Candidatus Saccharimonadales bacterium]|nr:hypothetical protein [Candidatus Saccharimonadales bacterium]